MSHILVYIIALIFITDLSNSAKEQRCFNLQQIHFIHEINHSFFIEFIFHLLSYFLNTLKHLRSCSLSCSWWITGSFYSISSTFFSLGSSFLNSCSSGCLGSFSSGGFSLLLHLSFPVGEGLVLP